MTKRVPRDELPEDVWDLLDEEGWKSVHREVDDDWRHECTVVEVWEKDGENTYIEARYRESGDGEYNKLRDDYEDVKFHYVEPYDTVVTRYRSVK